MLYLIKLNIALAAIYLLYQLLYRRLTFYGYNRWYLLLYPAAALFIPLINISPILNAPSNAAQPIVGWMPTIDNYDSATFSGVVNMGAMVNKSYDWSLLIICMVVIVSGVLLLRLLLQLISLKAIKRNAVLLYSMNGVDIYSMSEAKAPFSFMRSIFINKDAYTTAETAEIIRHEMVHATQWHSIDILFSELLCIVNWFNPFVWMLRKMVRQNLEFLADNNVLQKGGDKKSYQYLLLKVVGQPSCRIANSFNLSNLKKRIVMMNKNNSTKMSVASFLFVVPLMLVLLLAFRGAQAQQTIAGDNEGKHVYYYTGYVLDAKTLKGIAGVSITEEGTAISTVSDKKGFYVLNLPDTTRNIEVAYVAAGKEKLISRSGYGDTYQYDKTHPRSNGRVIFAGMKNADEKIVIPFIHAMAYSKEALAKGAPTKELIQPELDMFMRSKKEGDLLEIAKTGNEKVYFELNGRSYLVTSNGSASLTPVTDVVFVNGEQKSCKEINNLYKRSDVRSISSLTKKQVKEKYGVDSDAFEINTVAGFVDAKKR